MLSSLREKIIGRNRRDRENDEKRNVSKPHREAMHLATTLDDFIFRDKFDVLRSKRDEHTMCRFYV